MEEEEYNKRIENEKKFYNKDLYTEDLIEKANDALVYVLDKVQERVAARTGYRVVEYVINVINEKSKNSSEQIKILSLGTGPGGGEIRIAQRIVGNYEIDCLDVNEDSLKMGQKKAGELGLHLNFKQVDINQLELPKEHYDVIYAHAVLHHIINLEHISKQVKKSMKFDSKFIVYDGIARNGLRLWPETKEVTNRLFQQ